MFLNKTNTILLGLTGSCLILGGCSTDKVTGRSGTAAVRYVNALTGGTGSLVFDVNESTTGQTVAYQSSAGCQSLNSASTDFSVTQSGSSTVLASVLGQTLTSGGHYTLIASGTSVTPSLVFLNDSYTTPATGRARIRVLNAVGSATTFDVYINAQGAALGTPVASSVGFNTSQGFIDEPAGSTQITVTPHGTQTVLGSVTLNVNSGDITTVVFTPATTLGGAFTSFAVQECP